MSSAQAQDYPWPEPPLTGVVHPQGVREAALDEDLVDGRVPVLAVGSNASPTVLRRKLGDHLRTGLPVSVGRVRGLAVGHSAHVSAGGYVPAAPAACPGAVTTVAVAWLSGDQLEVLDATEPNYERVVVDGSCVTAGGLVLEEPQLYDSRHGVLGRDGAVLPLSSQAGVLAWLRRWLPEADELGLAGPGDVHAALTVAERRERVRTALTGAGLVLPSGF